MRPKSKTLKIIQPDRALYSCKTVCLSQYKAHCINLVDSKDVIYQINKILNDG